MPRLTPSKAKPYGVGEINNRELFRERLMHRFASHEWARVINIDNEPFIWQYLPNSAEEFALTPDPMKITHRGDVEMYVLAPGESEVILGENAYIMIEALYKKLISKKYIMRHGEAEAGVGRNFNWTDSQSQEDFIDKIFLGKEFPTFGGNSGRNVVVETPKVVTPDKEENDAPKRIRRARGESTEAPNGNRMRRLG